MILPVSLQQGRGHTGLHLQYRTKVSDSWPGPTLKMMYARLRLFERTALDVEGGVYLQELGPEFGVAIGEPKEET